MYPDVSRWYRLFAGAPFGQGIGCILQIKVAFHTLSPSLPSLPSLPSSALFPAIPSPTTHRSPIVARAVNGITIHVPKHFQESV